MGCIRSVLRGVRDRTRHQCPSDSATANSLGAIVPVVGSGEYLSLSLAAKFKGILVSATCMCSGFTVPVLWQEEVVTDDRDHVPCCDARIWRVRSWDDLRSPGMSSLVYLVYKN